MCREKYKIRQWTPEWSQANFHTDSSVIHLARCSYTPNEQPWVSKCTVNLRLPDMKHGEQLVTFDILWWSYDLRALVSASGPRTESHIELQGKFKLPCVQHMKLDLLC